MTILQDVWYEIYISKTRHPIIMLEGAHDQVSRKPKEGLDKLVLYQLFEIKDFDVKMELYMQREQDYIWL